MAEKTFKARVQHKTQTSEQWEQATNFTPKKGEIVVVQEENSKTSQLKVGNGIDNVNALEPISSGGEAGGADLPLSKGSGEDSLIIGEGTATGKNSIAAGTSDNGIVTELVGSTIDDYFTIAEPKANGTASQAHGASTVSYSSGSRSYGINSQAGYLGYYIWEIDGNTLVLSTTQNKSFLSSRKKPNSEILKNWTVGMTVSAVAQAYYPCFAKITEIDPLDGTITVDNVPFSELGQSTTMAPHDSSIIAIPDVTKKSILGQELETTRPNCYGEVDLGIGAVADGFDNIAAGIVSTAFGYRNTAIGTAAFVTGRDNFGGFATLTGGLRNKALGESSAAVGRENTASGRFAFVSGYMNESTGNASVAEGVSNKASGKAAHAEGTNTEASGENTHAEGSNTKASGENAHADGYKTIASGFGSQAHGTGTIAQRRNQTVIGKYNEVDTKGADETEYGSYAFIVGKGTGEDVIDESGNITTKKRSNAATIDWKGGAWFAGALTADKGIKSYVTAGQKSKGVLGQYATAEGYNVEAQADYSHAEGKNVIIKENDNLVGVIGDSQGKEVFWSSDKTSFQVANDTIQVGNHALINDYFYEIVDKIASDDDNFYTTYVLEVQPVGDLPANLKIYKNPYLADGVAAHSEGIGTIAIGQAQHVQGKYNLENGQYAHIVGNGVNEENRSNAHTLDWDGNAWYKGTLTADKGLKSYVVAGQKQGTTLGANATAEGINTTATGTRSHAEGNATSATGANSHAEGSNTIAEGNHSHAEGYGAKAKGSYTHAEGANTVANGDAAHAEGAYTIAAKTAQHVQGRYNREDTETDPNNTNLGKYAHIVGNGTATKRSNAHTLDWSGNAWFAGDVVADDVSLQELNSQVVKTINDISAALDSLIIVQAEFSNDAIAFTIDGTKYVADIGMTWGQWRYSPYSRDEFELEGYGIVHWATNKFIALDGVTIGDLEKPAEYTKIIAGANYTLE